jgi:alkyl sulfatase BDS1-like metallo-beta-lactamase superfamily hydrolase
VELAGGPEAMLAAARRHADTGDLRFAATLLNHLVFADPGHEEARETLAGVYERLGHGAENGPWRNIYLTGALELREGARPPAVTADTAELTSELTVGMLLDALAVRIDGPRAAREPRLVIDLVVIDEERRHRINLEHGALTHRSMPLHRTPRPHAGLTLTLTRPELLGLLSGHGLAGIETEGDRALLKRLFSYVTRPDRGFPIVTP